MRILTAILAGLWTAWCLGGEAAQQLDQRLIGLLLEQAEVVVHCQKATNGVVGMSKTMKQRYGLPLDEGGFWLDVKGTILGPKIEEAQVLFRYTRGEDHEPFFVGQGDYLLFLKRDQRKQWVLVADYFGIQPLSKGLDDLVRQVNDEKRSR